MKTRVGTIAEHVTHLTIDVSRNVHHNSIKDQGHKTGHA
jgi:hypothetical protein